jgi:hypothetical protein
VDPDVSQTMQPYAYAAGDPVANSDPSGLGPKPICEDYCDPTGDPNPPHRHKPAPPQQQNPSPPVSNGACSRFTTCNTPQKMEYGNGLGVMQQAWDWLTGVVKHHWNQISDTLGAIGIATCLVASAGICMVVGAAVAMGQYVATSVGNGRWKSNLVGLGLNLLLVGAGGAAGRYYADSTEAFWNETPFNWALSKTWKYMGAHELPRTNWGWVGYRVLTNVVHTVPGVCSILHPDMCN